jgi:outer membrane protein insertion porin family
LNGGVSGYAGSFFGIEYQTNNFLGYGETLQLAFSGGNRQVYAAFGFTEPYLLGKPISLGFNLFVQRAQFVGQGFDFASQSRAITASAFGLTSVDASSLFTQRTYGGSVSLSGQMSLFTNKFAKFSRFARLGLSYSLTSNTVEDPEANRDTDPTNDIPVTFRQPAIVTSQITPSLYYNTKNAYIDPTRGQSIYLGFGLAGLGGDVRTLQPSFEYQLFVPALRRRTEKPHVIAMRFRADHIRTFGTPFTTDSLAFVGGIPIYSRFFLGGENDIRGYNFRSVSPVVPYRSYASTKNPRVFVRDPNNTGNLVDASTVPQPPVVDPSVARQYTYQAPFDPMDGGCGLTPTFPSCNVLQTSGIFYPIGGDTQFIYNLEYRVPIVSVLSIAAFSDFGAVFNARGYPDQIVKSQFNSPIINQGFGNISSLSPGAALTGDGGVFLTPSGRVATKADVDNGNLQGVNPVYIFGDSRTYSIADMDDSMGGFLNTLRSNLISSMGLEFRVQMPVINVPFRLIWAYNPQARTDPTDPRTFGFIERKSVFRFSVGRTF